MGHASTNKFKEADELYREGFHMESLALLSELNAMHPGEKNILFPMARCYAKLGESDEAMRLCRQLVTQFDHPRAAALLEFLQTPRTPSVGPPPLPDDGVMQSHLDVDTFIAEPPRSPGGMAWGIDWRQYWIPAAAVAGVLLLFLLVPLLGGNQAEELALDNLAATPPEVETYASPAELQDPDAAMAGDLLGPAMVGSLIVSFLLRVAVFYIVLMILGKHLFGNLRDDLVATLKTCGVLTFMEIACIAIGGIPFVIALQGFGAEAVIPIMAIYALVGGIALLVVEVRYISSKYEMSCGEIIGFFVLQLITGAAVNALWGVLF